MDVIVDANITATAGTFQLWIFGNTAQRFSSVPDVSDLYCHRCRRACRPITCQSRLADLPPRAAGVNRFNFEASSRGGG
jgi:hypothetical protein